MLLKGKAHLTPGGIKKSLVSLPEFSDLCSFHGWEGTPAKRRQGVMVGLCNLGLELPNIPGTYLH